MGFARQRRGRLTSPRKLHHSFTLSSARTTLAPVSPTVVVVVSPTLQDQPFLIRQPATTQPLSPFQTLQRAPSFYFPSPIAACQTLLPDPKTFLRFLFNIFLAVSCFATLDTFANSSQSKASLGGVRDDDIDNTLPRDIDLFESAADLFSSETFAELLNQSEEESDLPFANNCPAAPEASDVFDAIYILIFGNHLMRAHH